MAICWVSQLWAVHVDVVGLRRLHVAHAAHHRVKARLGFELAVDENVTHARRRGRMIFNFRRRPNLGMEKYNRHTWQIRARP